MKSSIITLALITASCYPSALSAQEHHDDRAQGERYYDSKHKDYHSWNSDEDQKYHQYLKDNHRKDRDFKGSSKRDQQAYWDYRHNQDEHH